MRLGFDNEKYLQMQSSRIQERISQFGGKLYLEFGGKLFDDYHASRVLPGFKPDSKINMLVKLKDQAEIVIVINAGDIEKNKVRGDLGITYDMDVLRLIDAFRGYGLYVGSVVLTQFNGQSRAIAYEKKLEALEQERDDREYKSTVLSGFLFEMMEFEYLDAEFTDARCIAMPDHVSIYADGRMVYSFLNGSDITVML